MNLYRRIACALLLLCAIPASVIAQPAPVPRNDVGQTGTISYQTGAVTLGLNADSTCSIEVAGTFVGTLQFQGSIAAGSTFAVAALPVSGGTTSASTTTSTGRWVVGCGGFSQLSVVATAWTSGKATVTLIGSMGSNLSNVLVPVNPSPGPTAANGVPKTAVCDPTTGTQCAKIDANGVQAHKVCDATTSTLCAKVDTNGTQFVGYATARTILTASSGATCTSLAVGPFPVAVLQNAGPATTVFPQLYDEGTTPTCAAADVIFGDGSTVTLGAGQVIMLWAGVTQGIAYKSSGALASNLVIAW